MRRTRRDWTILVILFVMLGCAWGLGALTMSLQYATGDPPHVRPVTLRSLHRAMKVLPEPPRPVVIRIEETEGYYGLCNLESDGVYTITIDRTCDERLGQFILIHEWAHALAWDAEKADRDHNDDWGRAYAQSYRAYIGDR